MKSIPLISFHTIIDEDLACLKYAILDIGINPSFNLDSIKSKTFYNIVHDLYMRKYKNPLYYIKSDNANTKLLYLIFLILFLLVCYNLLFELLCILLIIMILI